MTTGNLQQQIASWRDAVNELARTTGVTAYLMGRSGFESVCLYRAEGSGVVRVIPVEPGQRRPLGVGAGATALLASTADLDLDALLKEIEPHLKSYPALDLERIKARLIAVNSADDEVNPPELGILEREIKRVKNGRYVLIPISDETRGHGTHSIPKLWKQYVVELLATP